MFAISFSSILFYIQNPNQLIYAELDIKAAQPVVQSKSGGKKLIENQDKTEYAEILYVSPPNNTQASNTSPKTIPTTATIEDEIKNNKPKEIEIK